jgi:hypothetical protein
LASSSIHCLPSPPQTDLQEIVWSPTSHIWFSPSWGRVKLYTFFKSCHQDLFSPNQYELLNKQYMTTGLGYINQGSLDSYYWACKTQISMCAICFLFVFLCMCPDFLLRNLGTSQLKDSINIQSVNMVQHQSNPVLICTGQHFRCLFYINMQLISRKTKGTKHNMHALSENKEK